MIKLTFNEEWCKECGLCSSVCPKGAIGMAESINSMGYHPARLIKPESCIGCSLCALMCPDTAIKVEKEEIA